jgi:nicotinamidase-related amidase
MSDFHYDASRTGLLLVDPYNDFLSDGGKLWPMVKGIADEVGLLDNLRSILAAARAAGVQVFFVPHRRWEPGDYEDWDHPNSTQRAGGACMIAEATSTDEVAAKLNALPLVRAGYLQSPMIVPLKPYSGFAPRS